MEADHDRERQIDPRRVVVALARHAMSAAIGTANWRQRVLHIRNESNKMSDGTVKPAVDLKTGLTQKLLGQEMNTIILVVLLASFGYAFWWGITTGVPAHLREIKSGYMEVATEHGKQQESLQRSFEKTLDRIERRGAGAKEPIEKPGVGAFVEN